MSPAARTREIIISLLMALQYAYFSHRFYIDMVENSRVSSGLYLFMESALVFIFLTRRLPKEVSFQPRDWIYATLGTWASMLYLPTGGEDIAILAYLQMAGICIAGIGILSLNRSFGIVPANRGIRTNGMYRFVRHPIYFGYIVTAIALVSQNISVWNIGILLCSIILQALRILREEDLLSKDPAYQNFMNKTRYRLLPFIW